MLLTLTPVVLAGAITGYIDVAQITLYIFFAFFAGLVFYLQRESRREGFPLTNDGTDTPRSVQTSFMPSPKTYLLQDGSTVLSPNGVRESQDIKAKRMGLWHGSAHAPTGNPMTDAVGPASYANRADVPDKLFNGQPRIVPLRTDGGYHIDHSDTDPVGMTVVGADGVKAGTVSDVWVDRAEAVIRYLEVSTGTRKLLLPMNFTAKIDAARQKIVVNAILGGQFAAVPATKNPDLVTLLEEDKIMAYYGGGLLYATPARSETLI